MIKRTEEKIIRNVQEGDSESFKELFETHKDLVYSVCYRFFENKDDAKDASQDIFIKVFHSINSFKFESKFSTWLYRISVNYCLNETRKRKSIKWLSLDILWDKFDRDEIITRNKAENPHQNIERKEAKEMISKALDSLPPNQKTAIILSKFEDLSYNEISRIMNCSVSSVESLLFRAKQNLAKKLLKYFR
jgi:RNA polymerase sigma-70 factor (ECF subfamily)